MRRFCAYAVSATYVMPLSPRHPRICANSRLSRYLNRGSHPSGASNLAAKLAAKRALKLEVVLKLGKNNLNEVLIKFDYSGILDITFKIERPVIKDKASESFTAIGVFDAAITGHEKNNNDFSPTNRNIVFRIGTVHR